MINKRNGTLYVGVTPDLPTGCRLKAGMTILFLLFACISPKTKPYTLQTPAAQTGPQHVLLGQGIDINLADAVTLEALPGVGPALAQRIVDYRDRHGPFATVQDLQNVRGIGQKALLRLAPLICVTSKNWQK
jgi:competence ComEA-like helix-hairpin-helix protein